ncbi:hypothetical protein OB2597_05885 [Pseudooceanicola batsensis HTCC2597]|uniref:Phosphonate metabolism protein n=1 Tax=Pseudooceanicola batsensis (strain ATCC BAA-863 / DSM 15984 / KCTC 12145 / HTCC2597) TaxID=252305 RepID=A3TT12_PSEBH|nr:DUF1045 domain-containing protein [Pseudooceanicola batsensis]EAQ04789.1 hypothetical protein OB2597_05885 [Pseudooceanicola batsensis HTCC2597]
MTHSRYAIYVCPEPGPLAAFGADWLGWDIETGRPRPHPDIAGLPLPVSEITATPRKYGFHGTIKPPFRLASGQDPEALREAARGLCAAQPEVRLEGLRLERLGRFLALVPTGGTEALSALAASVVDRLDGFRAPPDDAELARRRARPLSPRQDALLARWGYPYVMEEFRFHLTLTGPLPRPDMDRISDRLREVTAPILPAPFVIRDLCLVGERPDTRFEVLERLKLSSSNPWRCAQ